MILQLEFLNFFSRCVYFDLAIRVLITTVPGHTASFHACSMLVPTIPKSMEASSTVTTYLELSWCNQCCCGGEYVSWHVVLYIINRKQLSDLNAVGFLLLLFIIFWVFWVSEPEPPKFLLLWIILNCFQKIEVKRNIPRFCERPLKTIIILKYEIL